MHNRRSYGSLPGMATSSPDMTQAVALGDRVTRFFFMHIGSFVAVIVYFNLCERATYSAAGVRAALLAGLAVMSGYIALAYRQGELKQFDFGLWTMFALGTFAAYAGMDSVLSLFQHYSAAILFVTLGLVALVPLLLGREPFTYYYARRQTPPWQQKLPEFAVINRVITVYWVLLFFTAAGLAAWAPYDWRFTVLYPNLLIFVVGIPAPLWLPPLYLKLFPPGPPQTLEPVLMGMPFAFDRKAAGDVQATIQFCVSGLQAGNYYIRIAQSKCESFEGTAPTLDLTVYAPDTVWLRIARGELEGAQALRDGLYRVEGDFSVLMKMGEWFPRRR
ncbi:MAG: SCP2 sterol-binding domain-containing protein [Deltaproteobacteria bacterium]|nr:SCP2 sterol-binding domain-containing protein [Deltaproteobacteria bacterium]